MIRQYLKMKYIIHALRTGAGERRGDPVSVPSAGSRAVLRYGTHKKETESANMPWGVYKREAYDARKKIVRLGMTKIFHLLEFAKAKRTE